MRKVLAVLLCLFICSPAYAVTYCKRFPTDTAVACYGPDYPPPAGSSTNVGIGTTGRHVVYTGSTTAGPSSSVFENPSGNIGINTVVPTAQLNIGYNSSVSPTLRVDNGYAPSMTLSNQDTQTTTDQPGFNGTVYYSGQVFTLASPAIITSATFYMSTNTGSPTGTWTVSIQTTSAGLPTGTLADAGLTSPTYSVTPNATNVVNFTASVIPAGTYALVLKPNTLPQISGNQWNLFIQAGTSGGKYVEFMSGSWLAVATINMRYIITGTASGQSSKPFVITNQGNVGILTSTPVNQLDVGGSVAIGSAYAGISTAPSNGLIVQGNIGVGTTTPQAAFIVNDGNVGIGTWTADGAKLIVKGTAANGAAVGIGTSLPAATLDVISPGSNNIASFTRTAFPAFIIGASGNDVKVGIDSSSASGLRFQTNAATRVIIDSTGNVGIGTTTPQGALVVTNGNVGIGTWSPSQNLSVNGNIGIGTTLNNARIVLAEATANTAGINFGQDIRQYRAAAGTWEVESIGAPTSLWQFTIANGGIMNIANGGGNQSLTMGSVVLAMNGKYVGTNDANSFSLRTNNLNRLTVDSAGNVGIGTTTPGTSLVVWSGNVGIGTWSAGTYALEVSGGNGGAINNTSVANFVDGITRSNPIAVSFSDGRGYAGQGGNFAQIAGGSGKGSALSVNATSGFSSATLALIATSSGNIGIGTTDPQTRFAVTTGNVGIGTWTSSALLDVNGNANVGSAAIGGTFTVGGVSGVSRSVLTSSNIRNFSGTEANPRFNFDRDLTGSTQAGFSLNPDGSLTAAANGVGLSAVANRSLGLFTSNGSALTERVRVDSVGNIGIGTTTPQGAFVVTNGNVGIGTWAPQQLLQINGPFRQSSLDGVFWNCRPANTTGVMTCT